MMSSWSADHDTAQGSVPVQLSMQATLLNVSNLDRSIEFYQHVFELRLAARDDRVAALMIDERIRRQALVLRELGPNPIHAGRGSIGPRLVALETDSPDELDVIEQRLVERKAFTGRRQTKTWKAVVGSDPDRIAVSVSSSLTGSPMGSDDWNHLDQIVYELGE
jgi:catechol 2,3-dioxygenase-like lactoylglutathione lyase family enzyme